MAEYCDTLQSKEKRNREYKACLNDRALRLLDHDVTLKLGYFAVPERDGFASIMSLVHSFSLRQFCSPLLSLLQLVPGFIEVGQVVP